MNSFHVMWLCCWILFVGDIGQRFPSSQLSSLCPFSSVPCCFIKKWSQENEMCTQRQQGLTCAWINHVSFWYKLYVQINTFLWRLWSFFFKHLKGTTQSAVSYLHQSPLDLSVSRGSLRETTATYREQHKNMTFYWAHRMAGSQLSN